MKITLFLVCFLLMLSLSCFSQEDWRDEMGNLTYSPKYFGANAFPIPELRTGIVSDKYEIELRYDYHYTKGDNTHNAFGRLFIPFGKGVAALDVSWIPVEYYRTSQEMRTERNAHNTIPNQSVHGDVVIIAMYQILKSEKWLDADMSVGLKTASGNMLIDSRYTDAASYWCDVHLGRNIYSDESLDLDIRGAIMGGFYCYMTNSLLHRQNDASMLGGGLKLRKENLHLDTDVRGFNGYWNRGDRPVLFHSKLKYVNKIHNVYLRFQTGLHDYIYQTYSVGYAVSF